MIKTRLVLNGIGAKSYIFEYEEPEFGTIDSFSSFLVHSGKTFVGIQDNFNCLYVIMQAVIVP